MDILTKRERFYSLAPQGAYFLETDVESLGAFLAKRDWLKRGEFVQGAAIAGQGNMNYIVRVTTNARAFILKQSRPWVEKYSDIMAPFDRALVEAAFYGLVSGTPAADFMPKLHWVDEESRILCLEDLGALGDFTNVYSGVPIQATELEQLCRFLSVLHRTQGQLKNREMRALNHFHIFTFPFETANNFDLDRFTPGLQVLADAVKGDTRLRARVVELGQVYLSEGDFLVHGDYFPGSWLRSAAGIKVIDPEFGFSGVRELDFAVMFAHLLICGKSDALGSLTRCYAHWDDLDQRLVRGLAGVEILRRLMGVAQLPLRLDLERKRMLIEEAVSLVLG
ncbi:MAG TPA: phosphotransferase [Acidobacteriaceae bacterium]|nr:phosphotransferase [Acidobacteriaceae bacterium]